MPSCSNGHYFRPSLVEMELHGLKWRAIGTSVAGSSHVAGDLPCQDSHGASLLNNGALILAVADGAGSAERAAEGSREAVNSSVRFLEARLHEFLPDGAEECLQLLDAAVDSARGALQILAGEQAMSSFATTLLIAVATDRWLSVIQIGDGAIVCQLHSGDLRVLTVSGSSEYINETTFVTSAGYLKAAHRTALAIDDVRAIALLSDGLQLLALRFADNSAHAPFFDPLFEFAESPTSSVVDLEEFLRSDRVCERTDDDKTLLLAVRNRGSDG